MYFNHLTNEARRQLINVQQRAEALWAVEDELARRYAGTMIWRRRGGTDYLYRKTAGIEKSLGARSPGTETTAQAFTTGKSAATERRDGLRVALQGMRTANRLLAINRVPRIVARILRRLRTAGVLGDQLCVVGTNALFAYEAHAGIMFERDLLATDDVDIALDARRNLTLAARTLPKGLMGLLRDVDQTFTTINKGDYRAVNSTGLMVDLITPESRTPLRLNFRSQQKLSSDTDDLSAVEVPRPELIVDAPRFAETAISEDGLPVWIAAADPRWWSAHKLWLSAGPSRNPLKRQRDRDQAHAAAQMLAQSWDALDLSDEVLAAIPAALRLELREAIASAGTVPAEW